jgi:hypothetical protein
VTVFWWEFRFSKASAFWTSNENQQLHGTKSPRRPKNPLAYRHDLAPEPEESRRHPKYRPRLITSFAFAVYKAW